MGDFSVGEVVFVKFPFSDLSSTKLRPAVVLASVGKDDFILGQITSKRYADLNAIGIKNDDFISGSLIKISYVRSTKLFTANSKLIEKSVATLKRNKINEILNNVISQFEIGLIK